MPPKPTDTAAKVLPLVAARQWRRRNRRVVFTNGVFDILHAGHVSLLERCRALGDALIVGVNSDASVRRLGKGPERPINPLKDRMRVIAGLACVDAVTSFGEDTPEKLLSLLRPDILVKGADYRKDQVAGRQHAGKVVLLSLVKGRSTTAVVRKLRP
ncbi:MAG: D-glycero-beta-D-manno-heptose 1-phosphate adenylyltransferase [Elusimicrobia bacterium]|nr:D-glycero-beta-D-manno-heptose 1-phosphate adenylyltransferase [Elusimicrobiota bacterium]